MPQNSILDEEKEVISVKEARKIMGKDAHKYTDAQIKTLINKLDMIAMLHFGIVPKLNK